MTTRLDLCGMRMRDLRELTHDPATHDAAIHELAFRTTIPNPDGRGPRDWEEIVTENSRDADTYIRAHLGCSIIDTESVTFVCYSCNITVKWIG